MKLSERIALLKAGYSKDEIAALIEEDKAVETAPEQEETSAPVNDYMKVISALASEVKDLKEAVYTQNVAKTEIQTDPVKKPEDILAELFSAPKGE